MNDWGAPHERPIDIPLPPMTDPHTGEITPGPSDVSTGWQVFAEHKLAACLIDGDLYTAPLRTRFWSWETTIETEATDVDDPRPVAAWNPNEATLAAGGDLDPRLARSLEAQLRERAALELREDELAEMARGERDER